MKTDVLKNVKQISIVAFSGALFGIGMVISGMADPAKVIGFLDITGAWDPSLAFVMGGALAIFVPAYLLLIKPRNESVFGDEIVCPTSKTIDKKLVVGAALFGIGWGLLGVCPGPAVASLFTGNTQVLLFIAAMLVGSFTAKRMVQR
ncbi:MULTISPECIES: YeeE/YedE family protein [unclassified Vibrio]|uniref:YeeE/YedE family protein n=1 Tax=unclassified Vibrio TaxID=2614977 RepID=UPI002556C63E|nr:MULTISPECIES: YeeE/YedE family protein [unclassified Vibrio]MDK9775865.1 YeeE/YedE family protein [Vibrio sp. D401a]MDK9802942.1 YeeE/YedE family protein [Vibrio sp. D406a]